MYMPPVHGVLMEIDYAPPAAVVRAGQMLNKVPEVTVYFWLIKVLCTTVGESFADYINETLGFGLTNTTLVFSAALVAVLVAQFRLRRYVPGVYWLAVVLISVVGTLLTDNLTDGQGVALWISTSVFAVLLATSMLACCCTCRPSKTRTSKALLRASPATSMASPVLQRCQGLGSTFRGGVPLMMR